MLQKQTTPTLQESAESMYTQKNTDRISVLPTYIISFVIMPLFFGTVTCIYISMLNTNTNISLIIPNVLSTIVPPLLPCVIIVVLSQDRKKVDDK